MPDDWKEYLRRLADPLKEIVTPRVYPETRAEVEDRTPAPPTPPSSVPGMRQINEQSKTPYQPFGGTVSNIGPFFSGIRPQSEHMDAGDVGNAFREAIGNAVTNPYGTIARESGFTKYLDEAANKLTGGVTGGFAPGGISTEASYLGPGIGGGAKEAVIPRKGNIGKWMQDFEFNVEHRTPKDLPFDARMEAAVPLTRYERFARQVPLYWPETIGRYPREGRSHGQFTVDKFGQSFPAVDVAKKTTKYGAATTRAMTQNVPFGGQSPFSFDQPAEYADTIAHEFAHARQHNLMVERAEKAFGRPLSQDEKIALAKAHNRHIENLTAANIGSYIPANFPPGKELQMINELINRPMLLPYPATHPEVSEALKFYMKYFTPEEMVQHLKYFEPRPGEVPTRLDYLQMTPGERGYQQEPREQASRRAGRTARESMENLKQDFPSLTGGTWEDYRDVLKRKLGGK